LRVLVLSDTHVPQAAREIPGEVLREAERADAVIHAGDWTDIETLGLLRGMDRPLFAVRGNMDGPEVSAVLESKAVFRLGGLLVGLAHGHGAPWGLGQRVAGMFDEDLDVLVFGHSHRALVERKNGMLLLNPGSPTDRTFTTMRSYGLLFVEANGARGEIRYL